VGTTYYFRAYAINSEGTTIGDDCQFTTITLGAPELGACSSSEITITTAKLSASVTSDGGATVTERGFYYGTSAIPTTNKTIVSGTTGAMNVTITALTAQTAYYFRAFATNSEGTTYGADCQFTTLNGGIHLTNIDAEACGVGTTFIYLAPDLAITNPSPGNIDNAIVSINVNFISGDVLGINDLTSGTISGISYAYSGTTGVLTLSGDASEATYQNVLRQVTLSRNSGSNLARTVSFNLGSANQFTPPGSSTPHFYKMVNIPNATLAASLTGASSQTYFGYQGYLATITSLEENNFKCLSHKIPK
jgi:hypothetical protein